MSINLVGCVYFGERWDVPAMEGAMQAGTPVGEPCGQCGVGIAEDDQGVLTVFGSLVDGSLSPSMRPVHRECQLRSVIGSVEHLEGRCVCHGAPGEHAAATPREEALRLRAWLTERGRW